MCDNLEEFTFNLNELLFYSKRFQLEQNSNKPGVTPYRPPPLTLCLWPGVTLNNYMGITSKYVCPTVTIDIAQKRIKFVNFLNFDA